MLVRDIPPFEKLETRTEQVDAFFRRVHPSSYETCMIMHNFDKVIPDDLVLLLVTYLSSTIDFTKLCSTECTPIDLRLMTN